VKLPFSKDIFNNLLDRSRSIFKRKDEFITTPDLPEANSFDSQEVSSDPQNIISVEEDVFHTEEGHHIEVEVDDSESGFLKAARWAMLLLGVMLPIWTLPITVAPVVMNKIFVFYILVIVVLLFYLFHVIIRGTIRMISHWSLLVSGGLLLAWVVSALFSEQVLFSFWGTGIGTTTVTSFIAFLIALWMLPLLFDSYDSLKQLFLAIGAGFTLFLLFELFVVTGLFSLFGFSVVKTFNTVGSWNSVALMAGFFALTSSIFFQKVNGKLFWVLSVLFALSLLLMFVVNFPLAWALLGVFALVTVSYLIWRRKASGASLLVSIMILAISVFAFALQGFLGVFNASLEPPIEIGVSHGATFDVVKETLKENLIFGSGPGTFGYDWDLYKPIEVNQTPFWSIRFNTGSSYIFSLIGEVGLLGGALFFLFIASVWYMGFRMLPLAAADPDMEVYSQAAFFGTSFLLVSWFLHPVNFTIVALGFFVTGVMFVICRNLGMFSVMRWPLFTEGARGFVSAVVIVLLIIGGFVSMYFIGSRYAGQILFAQGISSFNVDGNIDVAQQKINSSITLDNRNDAYFRALSQIFVVRARLLLQDQSQPTQQLLGAQFTDVLDGALNSAQQAISIAPLDFVNHRTLGKIYEFLVPLGVQGSVEAALTQYDNAVERAPKDPSIQRDRALIYLAQASLGDQSALELAEEALQNSVTLKNDYADGHFLLAQVRSARGNDQDAIANAEAAALLTPNNIGTLFQLGLLYYRNDRFAEAETVFTRAVAINNDYSNALYFLGLVHDKTGRKDQAIVEFERILQLNPNNAEVISIIANLKAGNSALFNISPPEVLPEERTTPPIQQDSNL
jgi:tetratricopeptide (TPR) repeat protein